MMNDAAYRIELQEELRKLGCSVHQPDDPPLFTREPRSRMSSHHWRWRDLERMLKKLGEGVSLAADGPRRTIRLSTPGLAAGTTPTFWASIQVILPGEVAGAHRHSANAFRFVMQGGGATTTVDGEKYPMHEGDLVLTPGGMWHDHEYAGREPMIWLDVLDIPLMHSLHATFFESYDKPTQPLLPVSDASWRRYGSGLMAPAGASRPHTNPLLIYPAAMARDAVRQAGVAVLDVVEGTRLEYRRPDGGCAMLTMGLSLQGLPSGFQGHWRRSTGSRLYYVASGRGSTELTDISFDWCAGDFIAIAPWDWHRHQVATDAGEALLFQVNDEPVLRGLGFYREEVSASPVAPDGVSSSSWR